MVFLIFSGQPSLVSLLEAEPLDNVMVLTSLGKGFGVPGLRLGYVYAPSAELRQPFLDLIPIWGVNALAEYFLELAIKFRPDLQRSVAYTTAERSRMRRLLAEQPFVRRVNDSGGNIPSSWSFQGEDPGIAARLRKDLLGC